MASCDNSNNSNTQESGFFSLNSNVNENDDSLLLEHRDVENSVSIELDASGNLVGLDGYGQGERSVGQFAQGMGNNDHDDDDDVEREVQMPGIVPANDRLELEVEDCHSESSGISSSSHKEGNPAYSGPTFLFLIDHLSDGRYGLGLVARMVMHNIRSVDKHCSIYCSVLDRPDQISDSLQNEISNLNVTLKHPLQKRKHLEPSIDWLNVYHESMFRFKESIPDKVTHIIAFFPLTFLAALDVKEDCYPNAQILLLLHSDLNEVVRFLNIDMNLGEKHCREYITECDHSFSLGSLLFSKYKRVLAAEKLAAEKRRPEWRPHLNHNKYFPTVPASLFHYNWEPPHEDAEPVIVTVLSSMKQMQEEDFGLIVQAVAQVHHNFQLSCPDRTPCWRVLVPGNPEEMTAFLQKQRLSCMFQPEVVGYQGIEALQEHLNVTCWVVPCRHPHVSLETLMAISAGVPVVFQLGSGIHSMLHAINMMDLRSFVWNQLGNKEQQVDALVEMISDRIRKPEKYALYSQQMKRAVIFDTAVSVTQLNFLSACFDNAAELQVSIRWVDSVKKHHQANQAVDVPEMLHDKLISFFNNLLALRERYEEKIFTILPDSEYEHQTCLHLKVLDQIKVAIEQYDNRVIKSYRACCALQVYCPYLQGYKQLCEAVRDGAVHVLLWSILETFPELFGDCLADLQVDIKVVPPPKWKEYPVISSIKSGPRGTIGVRPRLFVNLSAAQTRAALSDITEVPSSGIASICDENDQENLSLESPDESDCTCDEDKETAMNMSATTTDMSQNVDGKPVGEFSGIHSKKVLDEIDLRWYERGRTFGFVDTALEHVDCVDGMTQFFVCKKINTEVSAKEFNKEEEYSCTIQEPSGRESQSEKTGTKVQDISEKVQRLVHVLQTIESTLGPHGQKVVDTMINILEDKVAGLHLKDFESKDKMTYSSDDDKETDDSTVCLPVQYDVIKLHDMLSHIMSSTHRTRWLCHEVIDAMSLESSCCVPDEYASRGGDSAIKGLLASMGPPKEITVKWDYCKLVYDPVKKIVKVKVNRKFKSKSQHIKHSKSKEVTHFISFIK